MVRGLRELDLRKAPSISETIDWARTLAVLGVDELSAKVLSDTVSVVVKYDKDVRKSVEALPASRRSQREGACVATQRARPPSLAWSWGHPHDHGDDHDHGGHHHHHADESEADGKAVRAAKDKPGRFTDGYYGTPSRATSLGRRRPF